MVPFVWVIDPIFFLHAAVVGVFLFAFLLLILATRADRVASRIPIQTGSAASPATTAAFLRAGQGLLVPPWRADLVLLQTPTGEAWAVTGTSHQRLEQAEALSAADGGLWSAHLAEVAVQAETPIAT